MAEGIAAGAFRSDVTTATLVEAVIFQGVDYSYLRDNFSDIKTDPSDMRQKVVDFMMKAIVVTNV